MTKRDAQSRREALRRFMDRRDLKPTPWAKRAGVNPNTLNSFLTGKSQDMGTAMYEALASDAGASVDELLGHTDDAKMRILATVEQLLSNHEVDEVTIPLICERADIRPSVFLAHYGDLRDVLWDILERYNERSFADLRAMAPMYGSLAERLSYVFRRYFEQDCRHLRLTAILLAYSWTWTDELERRNRQQLSEHDAIIRDVLNDAPPADRPAGVDPLILSRALMAAYHQVLRFAVYDQETPDKLERRMRPFIDMMVR